MRCIPGSKHLKTLFDQVRVMTAFQPVHVDFLESLLETYLFFDMDPFMLERVRLRE